MDLNYNKISAFENGALDPNQVYRDYLAYCQYIDGGIQALQSKLPGSSGPQYEKIENAIAELEKLKSGVLFQTYQKDYPIGNSADFENAWNNTLKPQVDALLSLAPANPNAQKIEQNYQAAKTASGSLLTELSQDTADYKALQAEIGEWRAKIQQLQDKVEGNPQAKQDLATAENLFTALQAKADLLSKDISTLVQAQSQFSEELSSLQMLSQLLDPTDSDVTKASSFLSSIQGQVQSDSLHQALQGFSQNNPSSSQIQAMNQAIVKVQKDIGSVTVQGQAAYIDLGAMDGMSPQSIQEIVKELQAAGITQVELSFAQVSDPSSWEAGSDATFQAVIQAVHAAGIKVELSFGGANGASPSNWSIANPQQLASALTSFVKQYGLDGLDFDYELGSLSAPYDQNLLTFFETLHTQMLPLGIPMILTVMAGPSNSVGAWDGSGYGGGPIAYLFQNFSKCFDGLNLMMYGGPEYLTGSPNYLQMWLGKAGEKNGVAGQYGIPLEKIHVGFMDYRDGDPSGYPGSGTNGANAADVYVSALKALGYSPSDLGTTFWWPNEGVSGSGSGYIGVINALEQQIEEYNTELQNPKNYS